MAFCFLKVNKINLFYIFKVKGEILGNAIEVKNVEMHFNMSKEKVDNLKEYFIKLYKRQLMYEDFIALDKVSVDIKKGEVFGIIGRNGSGNLRFPWYHSCIGAIK